jgi:signal transduction histidine kinase
MDSMNPLMPLQEEFGLWVLGGLFYVSVLVAITSFVIIQMLVRSRQIYRTQSAALLLTLSLPWMAFAVYTLESDLLPVSLAPLVSAMTGILLLMANPSRLRTLDVVPIAHRVIIDGMSDPVFVLSEQRRIMQLNPAAEHLISSPAEDSIGKQMEAVLPQWSAFAEAPQKEQKEIRELVIGDDTYDVRSSQIADWRGRLTSQIWVLRNITERRRMEAELDRYTKHLEELVEERTRRLREVERLAAIGQTTAMVGHDLRNPLQAMVSTLYLARKKLPSPSYEKSREVAKLLDPLDEHISYMDKIVSDLQDYAGSLTIEPIETNLPDLIRDVLSTAKIPGTVTVSVVVQGELTRIVVDPALMRRVLSNLITNAVQAMPQGGELTIGTSKNPGAISISVQDTGEGIARENLEKLFNPFFTTKAKGQGLGLAVCKRILEAQGGKITVKSEVGRGSTFTVEIPTSEEQEVGGTGEEEHPDNRR